MKQSKDNKSSLADRLKIIRKNLKLSQKEMASKIGMSFPAWQGYELGKNEPGSAVIKDLVKLNYNANWILLGHGSMLLENEILNIKLLKFLLESYENYEIKLGFPLSHTEKAWAIGSIFKYYSTRDFEDETIVNRLIQDIKELHNLFELYKKIMNSSMESEMKGDVLKSLSKQLWYKEEAEIVADELINLEINTESSKNQ